MSPEDYNFISDITAVQSNIPCRIRSLSIDPIVKYLWSNFLISPAHSDTVTRAQPGRVTSEPVLQSYAAPDVQLARSSACGIYTTVISGTFNNNTVRYSIKSRLIETENQASMCVTTGRYAVAFHEVSNGGWPAYGDMTPVVFIIVTKPFTETAKGQNLGTLLTRDFLGNRQKKALNSGVAT